MKIYNFFIRTFICIIIFLVVSIICKGNYKIKNFINNNVYKNNITFSYFKNIYNRYLGGVFPIDNIDNLKDMSVFNEETNYSQVISYEDGVMLKLNNNLVSSLADGIIVYIGNKDKYGNVIIVEGNDGVSIWYGNVCNSNLKMYDNISKGMFIGEACDNYIYLVYSKDNKFLNYRDYL